MIKKDESISKTIEWLFSVFGISSIEIVDYWEADLCAIGIRRKGVENKLIYISTFGKKDSLYDFEIEECRKNSDTEYDVLDKGENITRDELKSKIKEFLFADNEV